MKKLSREELLRKFKQVWDFKEGLAPVQDFEDNEYHIKPDGTEE